MADRTVVRQGSVVSLSLGLVLTLAALGLGADGTNPATTPPKSDTKPAVASPAAPTAKVAAIAPENKPYKIKAWVSIDPRARVDVRGRETLIAGWKVMVARFVGAPWQLEVADGDGPLATNALEAVTPEMVIPEAKGFDKAWLIRVEAVDGQLSFAGREFDAPTAQVGLLCRRPASVLADGPRALLQLSLDIFAASGEVAEATEGKRKLRVQGALIPAASPIGQVISVGSVFRPSRIFYKPDGGIQRLDVIKSTYLVVERMDNGVALCRIVSALGNPLTDKVVGKAKMVGVGLKPASIPTKLRFTFFNTDGLATPGVTAEERPAAGYTVVATPVPDGTPREVGTTDREGRLVLEPGFAEGLVSLRLMAAGTEPLSQFPVMPGEMIEEKLINHIDPRTQTVSIESEIFSVRDEIVDLIAIRRRLESRMKSRANADNWADVKQLIDEWKTIPSRDALLNRVNKLNATLSEEAEKNKRSKVRTKTAVNLITDTLGLIDVYLKDDEYLAVVDAYERYQAQTAATKSGGKALPKAPSLGMGSQKNMAPGLAGAAGDFAPIGGGFSVALGGTPSETISKAQDGASDIKTYKLVDPTKGTFTVSYWDYPVAVASTDISRVLDLERDRLVALVPGGKLVRDQVITVPGLEAKEIEYEGLPAKNGEAPTTVSRIFLANARVFSVSITGTKALVSAQPAIDYLKSFRSSMKPAAPGAGTQAAAAPPTAPPAPPASTSAGAKGAIEKAQNKAADQNKSKTGGQPF